MIKKLRGYHGGIINFGTPLSLIWDRVRFNLTTSRIKDIMTSIIKRSDEKWIEQIYGKYIRMNNS